MSHVCIHCGWIRHLELHVKKSTSYYLFSIWFYAFIMAMLYRSSIALSISPSLNIIIIPHNRCFFLSSQHIKIIAFRLEKWNMLRSKRLDVFLSWFSLLLDICVMCALCAVYVGIGSCAFMRYTLVSNRKVKYFDLYAFAQHVNYLRK